LWPEKKTKNNTGQMSGYTKDIADMLASLSSFPNATYFYLRIVIIPCKKMKHLLEMMKFNSQKSTHCFSNQYFPHLYKQ